MAVKTPFVIIKLIGVSRKGGCAFRWIDTHHQEDLIVKSASRMKGFRTLKEMIREKKRTVETWDTFLHPYPDDMDDYECFAFKVDGCQERIIYNRQEGNRFITIEPPTEKRSTYRVQKGNFPGIQHYQEEEKAREAVFQAIRSDRLRTLL